MPDYGWLRLPPVALPPPTAWKRWGRNLALFVLTAASVFWIGGLHEEGGFSASAGMRLVLGLLSILAAHEMGHYVAARLHKVDVTLPFFVPFPLPFFSLVGTLGAFIRIRSQIPHRRALFDIGVAGPLAGFLVALPVLRLGILEATVSPEAGLSLGTPLLFSWFASLFHAPVPEGMNLVIGPLGLAAWFGLLVTALNLMPIGQLDGGHVTYSFFRERAHRISRIASWVCVALIYFGPSWILWAVLMRVLGRRHPPTRDDQASIGAARIAVGVLSLVVFVLCFVPDPIVFSWRDAWEELRALWS
jgi:membrane-associated protease RseP (regulator of RpoE activity)